MASHDKPSVGVGRVDDVPMSGSASYELRKVYANQASTSSRAQERIKLETQRGFEKTYTL